MSYVSSVLRNDEQIIGRAKVTGWSYLNPFNFIIFAFLKRWCTEMVVTNQRIIHKRGFIFRSVTQIPLSHVESVGISQGIFGRLFGWGTVTVTGSGGKERRFSGIGSPLNFERAVVEAQRTANR
jgi:uncharacterized membrane protein YdbT with pleckstrin-like domain